MDAKHTQGPWEILYGGVDESDQGFGIASKAVPGIVAECYPPVADLERRRRLLADARLIAAAPELLAACKAFAANWAAFVDDEGVMSPFEWKGFSEAVKGIYDAVAKADAA